MHIILLFDQIFGNKLEHILFDGIPIYAYTFTSICNIIQALDFMHLFEIWKYLNIIVVAVINLYWN